MCVSLGSQKVDPNRTISVRKMFKKRSGRNRETEKQRKREKSLNRRSSLLIDMLNIYYLFRSGVLGLLS